MKKKILFVFGTRPEAIKMAPLIIRLKNNKNFIIKVCLTGQHRYLLDQVINFFKIKVDYDLNIMKKSQNLNSISVNILPKLRLILNKLKPDIVLVHGDTTTTFIASLASFYEKIQVGHIEAGLRSQDIYSPWPEEANRKLTSVISDYHFAPTLMNKRNLIKEGINSNQIFVTGNTVIDSLNFALKKIKDNKKLEKNIINNISISGFNYSNDKFILITAHRRENFGNGLIDICEAIKVLAIKNKNLNFVYPVHPNPNISKTVYKILSNQDNIFLIKPLDYPEFIYLLNKCLFVLTDSGGIQEEAISLGKKILIMRDVTERNEAFETGLVKLVGSSGSKIISETNKLISNLSNFKIKKIKNPFGNGNSSFKIETILKNKL